LAYLPGLPFFLFILPFQKNTASLLFLIFSNHFHHLLQYFLNGPFLPETVYYSLKGFPFFGTIIKDLLPTQHKEIKNGESLKIEFDSEPGVTGVFAIRMPLMNTEHS
jgi:hypothetical protein